MVCSPGGELNPGEDEIDGLKRLMTEVMPLFNGLDYKQSNKILRVTLFFIIIRLWDVRMG